MDLDRVGEAAPVLPATGVTAKRVDTTRARASAVPYARELLARVPGGRILCGLSGGKDSLVVLDLATNALGPENVEAFFMRLVPGIRCEMAPIEAAVKRAGVKLHIVPHWELQRMFRVGTLRPPAHQAQSLRNVSQKDVERFVMQRTGIPWLAYGHRRGDSVTRNAMLKQIDGWDPKGCRVYCIWNWRPAEVYAYLRARSIPIPKPLGPYKHGGGVSLAGPFLVWLKAQHPNDYTRLLNVFPFAEVERRKELAKQASGKADEGAGRSKAISLPKVHRAADAPVGHQGLSAQPAED